MRSDLGPGGIFLDNALPDHTNTVRKLSELQGDDPMVLTLAQGNYLAQRENLPNGGVAGERTGAD
jgi:hypothetical protein